MRSDVALRWPTMNFIDAAGRVLRSPAFKFVLILVLIIVLIVPLLMVSGLIGERESRAQGVRREVGQLWGPEQQILGPFLVVPYTVRLETVQGDKRVEQILERRAVFTPEALEVTGQADSQTLHRSIFEVPVYAARLKLSGRFVSTDRRRRRRRGHRALARRSVRARVIGRFWTQGNGCPQDRRHPRDRVRAKRWLPVHPPVRHPCQTRGRREHASRRRSAAATVCLHGGPGP